MRLRVFRPGFARIATRYAVVDAVADLRSRLNLGPDEDYFLARLSYPHLRPQDAAGFVRTDLGGRHQSDIVVKLDCSGDSREVRGSHILLAVGRNPNTDDLGLEKEKIIN